MPVHHTVAWQGPMPGNLEERARARARFRCAKWASQRTCLIETALPAHILRRSYDLQITEQVSANIFNHCASVFCTHSAVLSIDNVGKYDSDVLTLPIVCRQKAMAERACTTLSQTTSK